jgi:hypothetical protein
MWYPDTIGDTATSVSIAKALLDSFPYVRAFRSYDSVGIHFMASMEPIPAVSSSVLASRMPSAAVSDLVEWGPLTTPQQQFDLVLAHEFSLQKFIAREPRVPALQDDRPINEYFLLRHRLHFYN